MISVDNYAVTNTLRFYGDEQLTVAIEEMSELTKELCKFIRGNGDENHICEEIADVYIMLENVKAYFEIGDSRVNEYIKLKQIRTAERMKNET